MKRRIVTAATTAIVVVGFGTGLVGAGSPPTPPSGGHLLAFDPPNQFPSQGTAFLVPVIGRFDLDLLDPACGGGEQFSLDVAGQLQVGFPDAPSSNSIDIQIVSMELRGVTPLTVNGLGGSDVLVGQSQTGAGGLFNPSALQFPAQSSFDIWVQIQFQGSSCPSVQAALPVAFQGHTVGWPPTDAPHVQVGLPVNLETPTMDPAGLLTGSMLIPTTPSVAFLKAESIQHEAETRSDEADTQQGLEDALNELLGGIAPLPTEIDQNEQKIEEMRQFLQTMQEAIDAVSEQTKGADDCEGGDCGPLLEKKVDKLTKKVNGLRKLIKKLD